MKVSKSSSSREFQSIPGIGPKLAQDLVDLGYSSVTQLRKANPERMYQKLRIIRGKHIDRCVLYAFRCAVYYAGNSTHDPELLKWWNWKDVRKKRHH
jgi:hypothetical protein